MTHRWGDRGVDNRPANKAINFLCVVGKQIHYNQGPRLLIASMICVQGRSGPRGSKDRRRKPRVSSSTVPWTQAVAEEIPGIFPTNCIKQISVSTIEDVDDADVFLSIDIGIWSTNKYILGAVTIEIALIVRNRPSSLSRADDSDCGAEALVGLIDREAVSGPWFKPVLLDQR